MKSKELQELYLSLEHLSCWTKLTQDIILQLIKKNQSMKKHRGTESQRKLGIRKGSFKGLGSQ